MKYFREALSQLSPDQLIIVCDSYDVLFVHGPEYMEEKYHRLAQGKVVVGLENISKMTCNFFTICDPSIVSKCNIHNPKFPKFVYPNSGFLMGSAAQILDIYNFMADNNFKDDQYSLFQYIIKHCDEFYFDYTFDFVFHYIAPAFVLNRARVKLVPASDDSKNKEIIVNDIGHPGCVHIPGHYLDIGERSEKIRNFLLPHRHPKPRREYFHEFYMKICKPEFSYFGYWWWIMVLLFIAFCVLIASLTSSSSKQQ
jgi:hypothetical protein